MDILQIYFLIMWLLSLSMAVIYIYLWHRHYEVNLTMIFTLVPIACLGYFQYAMSTSLGHAVLAIQITYIGGGFMPFFMILCICNLCQIRLRKGVIAALFLLCAFVFMSTLTIGYGPWFYKTVAFENAGKYGELVREYGFLHSFYHLFLGCFYTAGLLISIYSWFRRKQVPRTILALLMVSEGLCLAGYFLGKGSPHPYVLVPMALVLSQVTFLLVVSRLNLYNVADTVIDSMIKDGDMGYASFDLTYRYLGSNETAKELLPVLSEMAVDERLHRDLPKDKRILHYLDSFAEREDSRDFVYTYHDPQGDEDKDRIYSVKVVDLMVGSRKRGYILTFADDTVNRKYIRLLDTYNESLKSEVEEKTRHIYQMHDNLIMSMAMMVESRDNSTGGHIKRTSEGVRILVEEMQREGFPLTASFCKDVIKAAPMHDLGKIAVDDAVLRKPGRFLPEEFEKMKTHAAQGAHVIHEILKNTDDASFKVVAENVAHFHHERWDGSGYPEHLKGEEIPLEARIMAIADVYDALVSKRVYKEAFDFAKADEIITEGMGGQFDPQLAPVYASARPRLEEYYRAMGDQ